MERDKINRYAREAGADIFGVAGIERFKEVPFEKHPKAIFPEVRSVIVVGKRIVRGGWRGVEEGTYWPNYLTFYNKGTSWIPF